MSRVNEGVVVSGIPELMRALKELDAESARQLRTAMRDIAKVVVRNAQGRMEFGQGAAASSLKAGGGIRGGWVSFPRGKDAADLVGYYPWLDFGGGKVSGRGVTAGGSRDRARRSTTSTGGRYVYPAIDEARQSGYIEDAAYDAIDAARRRAQLDGEGF